MGASRRTAMSLPYIKHGKKWVCNLQKSNFVKRWSSERKTLWAKRYDSRACAGDIMTPSVSAWFVSRLARLRNALRTKDLGNFYFAKLPQNRFPARSFCASSL